MSPKRPFDDEDDDFDDEFELDDAESSNDEDDDTMPCPHCGRPMYDDAEQCPACGRYLSDEERSSVNQPRWIIFTAIVVLAAILYAYLR